jgi:LAO/AO transport system kinase
MADEALSPSACSPATSARSRARSRSSRTTTPRAGRSSARSIPKTGNAPVVGFTGPPGRGKSTLIGALVSTSASSSRQVAVLSIDPSLAVPRGALLGDRIRLTEHFLDPGVFIRSMATRGALGGLAEAALRPRC